MDYDKLFLGIFFIASNVCIIWGASICFKCHRDVNLLLKELERKIEYEASPYEKCRVEKIFTLYPEIAKKHAHILKYKKYGGVKGLSHNSALEFFHIVNINMKKHKCV